MSDIWCYELKGAKYLLADERNKKHLLDQVLGMHERKNWRVYVFCLTDESAYVITDTGGDGTLKEEIEQSLVCFFRRYEGYLPQGGQRSLNLSERWRITETADLMEACREIHCLPVRLGYVHKPGDYWWSSYCMYCGGYAWPAVDCCVLLKFFSEEPEKAFVKFRRFHRKQTSILNNNE